MTHLTKKGTKSEKSEYQTYCRFTLHIYHRQNSWRQDEILGKSHPQSVREVGVKQVGENI